MLQQSKKKMSPINICLDFSPAYGGVVKAVDDFQIALGGKILSFDSAREERVDSDSVIYIDEKSNFLGKEHLILDRSAVRFARQHVLLEKANLLVAHSLFRGHCQWARKTALDGGLAYWAVPHGSLDPWVFTYGKSFKRFWMAADGKRYLRDASVVVFATERERMKARHIYDGSNTKVVHWPVTLLDLRKKQAAKAWLYAKLGIGRDERVILYLGRYDSMKRPLETIKAFSCANVPNCHLVLVGNDSGLSKDDLDAEITRSDAKDRIHVVGPLFGVEKNNALLGADAFISLSYRENFGYTTGEALSGGLPVILSPGNDLAHELGDVDCGWCLQSEELDEAVEAIKVFSEAPESVLTVKGENGRNWCERHLRPELFASSLRAMACEL